jgi:hypothetical protein
MVGSGGRGERARPAAGLGAGAAQPGGELDTALLGYPEHAEGTLDGSGNLAAGRVAGLPRARGPQGQERVRVTKSHLHSYGMPFFLAQLTTGCECPAARTGSRVSAGGRARAPGGPGRACAAEASSVTGMPMTPYMRRIPSAASVRATTP